MKKIIIFCIFCAIVINSFGQKETYDLVTYTSPKNWKKEVTDFAVGYSRVNNNDTSWCRITVYKSLASKGSIDLDFNSEWQILVATPHKTTSPSQINETQGAAGWKIKSGGGSFIFKNKKALSMITVFSGYDTCFSILAICNNEKYIQDIQNFIASIELKRPESSNNAVVNNSQLNNPPVIGSWGKSNSVSQLYNRSGTYSYNKQQYIFNANGTYTFLGKNYSEDYTETILIKESGTYTVNGDKLNVVPKTSVIESWSKKNGADNWGQLKSSHKRALEKATYQFKMEGRNLIVSISKETTRDGRFSNGNYYSYGPPETFTAIKLPD